MCVSLYNAMNDILRMEYFKNENHKSGNVCFGHESAVAQKLSDNGFSVFLKENFSKLNKKIFNEWLTSEDDSILENIMNLPSGSYILQPLGSQSFPDILVKDFSGRFIAIECKSSSGQTPMWNDNLPKPKAIYVLSSNKENATTAFMAKDVIDDSLVASRDQMIKELMGIVNKYNKIHETLDIHNRGWNTTFRQQNFQVGGKKKNDYFNHEQRELCERNALEFARGYE